MSTTPSATSVAPPTVDDARAVIADALTLYASQPAHAFSGTDLAGVLANNVQGWTHTTRLREYLDKTAAL